ncbi:MAG: hypothetical protein LBL52_03100, partial [Rickettsiales bacterium]|nr:hypothetical protein [Rickettsiales bacterium]
MEIARLGFSAFVLAMFASFSAYSQQYYYSDQSAQAQASPYQSAQYYPNRPLPKPYTDYTRSPVMSDDMAYSLKGYRTPNKYYIPPSVPKVVYAPNGLAIPDYAVQDNRDDPGVKYFMSVAYSQNKFTGTGMANDYIDYPMNNESGRSLGDGITTSFAFGAISRSGIRAEVFFSNLTGLRYGFNGIAA